MEGFKNKLFEAISNRDVTDFIEITVKKSEAISIEEFIKWLPQKLRDPLFTSLKDDKLMVLIDDDLLIPSGDQVDDMDESGRKNQEKILINSLKTFHGIISICSAFIQDKSSLAPNSLFDILNICHDMIFNFVNYQLNIVDSEMNVSKEVAERLSKMYGKLANEISLLCETWYKQDRPQKDDLVAQPILYLAQRAYESMVIADITRLWNMKGGLLAIDFSNEETSGSIREILLGFFVQPHFIKSREGKKMLTFLFAVKPQLIDAIHTVVKGQLVSCKKSVRDAYAEIYFNAWKVASGPFLLKIEYSCIQNIINICVHSSNQRLTKSLFDFLHYFHSQKKFRGVDEMLLRLYEPIIWRSLKVANPTVRANAAKLFIDVFPLNDSDSAQKEFDELLSKQMTIIQELLYDPHVSVRVIAVQGVFEILSKFWEIIPVQTSRILLSKIINDIVHDKSSGLVRETVFQGLKFLLDSSLSHSTLKILLPQLGNMIHDSSERVRSAFLDLLLYIKDISTIRFFDVVKMDHLLERMVIDYKNPVLSKKLTQLLIEPYFPKDTKSSVIVNRCINLIKTKKTATFSFYANVVNFAKLEDVSRFIAYLYKYIIRFIGSNDISQLDLYNKPPPSTTNENKENGKGSKSKSKSKSKTKKNNKKKGKDEEEEEEAGEEEEEEEEEEEKDAQNQLVPENTDDIEITVEDIESIMEIIYNTLESIMPKLDDEGNRRCRNGIYNTFEDNSFYSIYIWFFQGETPRVQGMYKIIKIASLFKEDTFTTFKELLIQNFSEIDQSTPEKLKESLLQCLFAWNLPNRVLESIYESLAKPVQLILGLEEKEEEEEQTKTKSKSKKRKSKSGDDEDDEEKTKLKQQQKLSELCEKASISISFLDMIFKNETTRNITFKEQELNSQIVDCLQDMYMPIIQSKLASECGVQIDDKTDVSNFSNSLLISSYVMISKLRFHCEGLDKIKKDSGLVSVCLDWSGDIFVPYVESYVKLKLSSTNKRKRSPRDEEDDEEEEEENENDETKDYSIDEKPLILEMINIYLISLTENLALGLCGLTKCIDHYQSVLSIVNTTKGLPLFSTILPTTIRYAFQMYYCYPSNPEIIELSNQLVMAVMSSIAANPTYERSDKPLMFFRLSDLFALHHQKSTLSGLIKMLIQEFVFKEFKIPRLSSMVVDSVKTDLDSLSPLSNFICSCTAKSSTSINQVSEFIGVYVTGNSMNQKSIYFSLNLISILINFVQNSTTKKIDCSSIQDILITFISKLPHYVGTDEDDDEEEEDDEEGKVHHKKEKSIVTYSHLLEISKNLLNLSMKGKQSKVVEESTSTTTGGGKSKKNKK
eukprot:gene806-1002_t